MAARLLLVSLAQGAVYSPRAAEPAAICLRRMRLADEPACTTELGEPEMLGSTRADQHCWPQLQKSALPLLAVAGVLLASGMWEENGSGQGGGVAGCRLVRAEEPITPREDVLVLFNGRDLDNFYTFLQDTKYEDPRQVFTVHDGLLHISGDGFGYLATRRAYRDYRLVAEFRWGERTWGSRAQATKDSGILLHATGPDGNAGPWMASIEFQIIQGGVGDFIVVAGKNADGSPIAVSLTCEVTQDRDGETVWQRGGQRQSFSSGRINWFGRDPDWKDVLGFRGRNDVEHPDGEWNRLEAICDGGRITNIVNGVVVNEGFDAQPSFGKILFQTEGAELFFRKIELWPLDLEPRP